MEETASKNEDKISLAPYDRKMSMVSYDLKTSTHERKMSMASYDRKISMYDRKMSISSRKSTASTRPFNLRYRKQSYGFRGPQGTMYARGSQDIATSYKRPPLIYLPTYQLEPRIRFNDHEVTRIIKEIIKESFEDHKYSILESPGLAMKISHELLRKTKRCCFDRYRLLSVVTIGQKRSQSYNNAISFLWDSERDSYANAQFETPTAFVQITIFGIYLD